MTFDLISYDLLNGHVLYTERNSTASCVVYFRFHMLPCLYLV